MQLFLSMRGQQKLRHHFFWRVGKKDREGEVDQQGFKVLSMAEKEWPSGRRRQKIERCWGWLIDTQSGDSLCFYLFLVNFFNRNHFHSNTERKEIKTSVFATRENLFFQTAILPTAVGQASLHIPPSATSLTVVLSLLHSYCVYIYMDTHT